jgi:hypothetical protein
VTPALDHSAPIPLRFWTSLGRDARLREAWFGERKDLNDTSGSGQHMALAIRLRQLGFTKREAATILPAAPGGKARFTEGYARVTLDKAYGG